MALVTDLDSAFSFVLEELGKAKLSDKLADSAGDWLIAAILQNHLPKEEQELFRDAYQTAPNIFDPMEFFYDTLPDFNELLRAYMRQWIAHASANAKK